jgi:CDP-diacylglycerol--serine O-phosphatidyltransferase
MNKRCWFPNFVTTANLFCGFIAVLFVVHAKEMGASTDGHPWFVWAALTICLAALFDALDGRLARALRVASPFGKQLDSLADIVSFGVAPAMLAYEHSFQTVPMHVLGMAVCGLFVCCGAARLARYNVVGTSGRFFTGMPIPAAGLTITGLALFPSQLSTELMAVVVLGLAFLMISTLRYPNPEQLIFDAPAPIRLLFMVIFTVALVDTQDWFFLLPVSYMIYGLLLNLVEVLRPGEA